MTGFYSSPYGEIDVPDANLADYVLEHAGRRGRRPALIDGQTGEVTTYDQLLGAVEESAAGLTAAGVRRHEVVALMSHNQPAWPIAYLAALRCGASVTPLNPALTDEEVVRQLAASRAVTLLSSTEALAKAGGAARAVGEMAVIELGSGRPAGGRPSVSTRGYTSAAVDPARDAAALPFSSGTTGLPKGVVLTHRNLTANLAQHEPVYHVDSEDVFLAVLPFFHIYGQTLVMNYGLRHGAAIVTLPRFDLDSYLDAVTRYRVTWLHLAPPIVMALASADPEGPGLGSVRHAVSGAAPLDAEAAGRAEDRLGCPITQGYGMTEAAPGTHFVPDDVAGSCPPGSVGVLIPSTEARVTSPADGQSTAATGELWVRGPQVMAGYLDDPVATAATVAPDGWMRTGDVVRVDDSGAWFVVDRVKELIKYKGYQVPPAELEAVTLCHPDVEDVAVVGAPDAVAGEIPVAFVVARAGLQPRDVMAWVAERVAPYKRIRRVVLVDAVPRSPSGKILRRQLREAVVTGAPTS